jgi:hypothetical protein
MTLEKSHARARTAENSVEREDGPARRKTGHSPTQPAEVRLESTKGRPAAIEPPLIQVAEQERRHVGSHGNRIEDSLNLARTAAPEKAKMGSHDP